jgi:putative phosphoesterase
MEVAEVLNSITDKLIVIKGNCDSDVDKMISKFSFVEDVVLVSGGKFFFLTHGHVYNKDNLPSTKFDGIIYGHFHTGFIENVGDMIVANTGSLSLPKNGTPNSYIVLEDGKLELKEI